jgi:hypothetical protein
MGRDWRKWMTLHPRIPNQKTVPSMEHVEAKVTTASFAENVKHDSTSGLHPASNKTKENKIKYLFFIEW